MSAPTQRAQRFDQAVRLVANSYDREKAANEGTAIAGCMALFEDLNDGPRRAVLLYLARRFSIGMELS